MSLKKQILNGSIWTICGQLGYMVVSLITNIILARILTPSEFGEMGILMFFVLIANILTQSGFGGALVRRKSVSERAYSTVFIFSIIISVFCYLILILCSSKIAKYYNDPKLADILYILGLVFIFNSISTSYNAKLIIEFKFKQKSISLFSANILAAIISIFLGFKGMGVWALVAFQLLTAVFNTIFLIYYGKIKFSLYFDFHIFRELYAFGVNTTFTSILATAFDNIYQLILGRYFSISQVGLFYQAKKLQLIPFNILNSVVQGVVYSSLAKLQEEKRKFMIAYNKMMLLFAILMAAITGFIFVYANGIILLLFGEKWIGAAFFMQLLSIVSFFYFQEMFNNIIFMVFNQTRKIFYLELVKKFIQILSIFIGLFYMNINALLIGFIVSSILSYGLNFYFSRLILGKESFYELYSIIKIALASIVCVCICLFFINIFSLSEISSLYTIPFSVLLFYLILKMFKVADLYQEIHLLLSVIRNK